MDLFALTGLFLALFNLVSKSFAADCLSAQAQCVEDRTCAIMLMMVPQLCGNTDSQTTCDAPDRLQCEGMLQILRQSQEFEGCTCDPQGQDYNNCQTIYAQLHLQQCTDFPTVTQETPTQRVDDTFDHQLQWNVETAPSGGRESTCIQALDACNGDATCRQSLLEYVRECRGDPRDGNCRQASCRQSIRGFLDEVSPRYTHALLYCYCSGDDSRCKTVRQGLNTQCANSVVPLPSCLDVKRQCARSALCSTNFENYKLRCAVSDTTGTGCADSYNACRDARLGILGTVVAASCTCRGLEGEDLKECNRQQLLVLDNSCFTRASLAYYPSAVGLTGRTTAQTQIVSKRVQDGCTVKLANGRHDIHVSPGHHVRIANKELQHCSQICRCLKQGYLSHCFDVFCNATRSCTTGHERSKDCVCAGGDEICIDEQLTPTKDDVPALMLLYSGKELDLIQRQLHVNITTGDIVDKLQDVLGKIYKSNPCILEIEKGIPIDGNFHVSGTIVLTAHAESRKTWECLNQMSDLSLWINTGAPSVAQDVVLSLIKFASIVRGALTGQIEPTKNRAPNLDVGVFAPNSVWVVVYINIIYNGILLINKV